MNNYWVVTVCKLLLIPGTVREGIHPWVISSCKRIERFIIFVLCICWGLSISFYCRFPELPSDAVCFHLQGLLPMLILQMPRNGQVGEWDGNSFIGHLQQCLLFSCFLLSCPVDSSGIPYSRLFPLDFRLPLFLPSFWPGVFLLLCQSDTYLSVFFFFDSWPNKTPDISVLLSIHLLLHQPLVHIAIYFSQQLTQTNRAHTNVCPTAASVQCALD